MFALLSLLLVIGLSIIATKVATIALIHTGLSRESARFQARSAFTGVGFTTSESEKIVSHPVRRKILMVLMLLGNAGIVAAVSSLILAFVRDQTMAHSFLQLALIALGLLILLRFATSQVVDRWMSAVISRLLKKYTTLEIHDFSSLLHLAKDYRVFELSVKDEDWMADRALQELDLRSEGLLVLGIEKEGGDYIGVPSGETKIEVGDQLVIYGRAKTLESLDMREKGREGEKEHHRFKRIQRRLDQSEK